jgi:hypothetical protein
VGIPERIIYRKNQLEVFTTLLLTQLVPSSDDFQRFSSKRLIIVEWQRNSFHSSVLSHIVQMLIFNPAQYTKLRLSFPVTVANSRNLPVIYTQTQLVQFSRLRRDNDDFKY